MSLPSRERGLKLHGQAGKRKRELVAPLAGAWIEINVSHVSPLALRSLPSRERGLKSEYDLDPTDWCTSLPSRERGLK